MGKKERDRKFVNGIWRILGDIDPDAKERVVRDSVKRNSNTPTDAELDGAIKENRQQDLEED